MTDRLSWERHGPVWPMSEVSRFVEAGGLRWHVQTMGEGPVALLLHGTAASTHSWARIAPLLARRFTVVAPDLPGHAFTGASPREHLTLPGMAGAVAALLRAMDISPALVIGHSAGAAVMIELAATGRIAAPALVGINAALRPFDGVAGIVFAPLAKLLVLNPFAARIFAWRGSDRTAVQRLLAGTGSQVDAQSLDCYVRLFSTTSHVAGTLAMMANWDLSAMPQRIRSLPERLLLLTGTADLAVPSDQAFGIRDIARNVDVRILRGAGHLAHEESPEQVAQEILAYFDARTTGA